MKTISTLIQNCLLAAILLALPVAAQAQFYQIQIYCTTNNGAITITGYSSGYSGSGFYSGDYLVIPSTINGLPVTSIGDGAFMGDGTGFNILNSVTIPDSVTNIGFSAFSQCARLQSFTWGTNVITIEDEAFQGCSSLFGVVIPDSVTTIGQGAFASCGFSGITLGANLTSIGGGAFSGCGWLTGIIIPGGVTNIGVGAFQGCNNLTNITVNASNPDYSSTNGVMFDKTQASLLICPPGLTGNYLIPSSVTNIETNAFNGCGSIANITLGTNVITIGDYAFAGCSVPSLTVPDSVTTIGNYAFSASSLYSLNLGANVSMLGSNLVFQSFYLTNITVNASNLHYSSLNGVLFDKAQTTIFAYPPGLSGSYTVTSTVTNIANYSFCFSFYLTNVTLGANVVSIGDDAFTGSGLTSLVIPNSVITIGQFAFNSCPLASVILGTSVANIEDGAFSGSHITSLIIPNSVTNIGQSAFNDSILTNVTLGADVINIGNSAFAGCAIRSLIIPNRVTNIGSSAFGYCILLTNITMGANVTTIGSSAFFGCKISSLVIPNSVITIGTAAFASCTSLTNVMIGSSVTRIGDNAFKSCPALSGIAFQGPAPVPSNDTTVFSGDNQALVFYLQGTTGWGATFDGLPTVFVSVPTPPALAISTYSNQPAVFFPTATGSNFELQMTTNLASGNWVTVTNGVPFSCVVITNPPTNAFFRLH